MHHLSIDFVNIEKKKERKNLASWHHPWDLFLCGLLITLKVSLYLMCKILAYWLVSYELRDVFVHSFEIFETEKID